MIVHKGIASGAAALLLGATGLLAGCDQGGTGDAELPPPGIEDNNNNNTGGDTEPLGSPPADNTDEQNNGTSNLPALPEPDDSEDTGGTAY